MTRPNEHWMLGSGSYCINDVADAEDLLNDAGEWLECARAITALLQECLRTRAGTPSASASASELIRHAAATLRASTSTTSPTHETPATANTTTADECRRTMFALQAIDILTLMSAHCTVHAHARMRWDLS